MTEKPDLTEEERESLENLANQDEYPVVRDVCKTMLRNADGGNR